MFTFQGSVLPELWKWALCALHLPAAVLVHFNCLAVYASVAALWMTLFKYTKHNDNWNQVDLSTHQLLSVPM